MKNRTAPAGVRIRTRLLGLRVSEPWLDWAEQDVRASTWPAWRGAAVTLWGALGFMIALVAFRIAGEPFSAGMALVVGAAYTLVIAAAVVGARTQRGRRMAIERLRRGWRAQPWTLVVSLLTAAWVVIWLLFLRPGA